jgi:hypothetical protein
MVAKVTELASNVSAPSTNNVRTMPSSGAIDAPAGLAEIYDALVNKAQDAIKWYESRTQSKKAGARFTRVMAILLGALATVIPSVIAFFPEHVSFFGDQNFALVKLNPVATIAGVFAATMILLDKFYGYSSSWMRFVTTHMEIRANLDEFKINWQKQLLRLNSNQPPTDEQVVAVYDFLLAFLNSVNASVRNETQGWITEFRGALADVDKTIEAQKIAAAALPTAASKGAINVTVADYASLDNRRWTLQVDNRKEETKEGQSAAAIPSLDPGIYKLRVAGMRKGDVVATERTVLVKAGQVEDVKLEQLG